jgi:hypothetical protein
MLAMPVALYRIRWPTKPENSKSCVYVWGFWVWEYMMTDNPFVAVEYSSHICWWHHPTNKGWQSCAKDICIMEHSSISAESKSQSLFLIKTQGVFYFVNFLCFYTTFFTHGFVFLFSILCFGFRFLLIYKWVMFRITKKQFFNCVPLKEIVILCIEVVMIFGMSSIFFCKHCITWLCFVLNPSGVWVPWNVGLCKD